MAAARLESGIPHNLLPSFYQWARPHWPIS